MRITLPWPDRHLSPNARVHWRTLAQLKKQAKEIGFVCAREVYTPGVDIPYTGNLRVIYHVYPRDRRAMRTDDDNLIASSKGFNDGVALALGVDDKQFHIQPLVWHDPDKGNPRIVMEIEEM